jgi:hypothetical protein
MKTYLNTIGELSISKFGVLRLQVRREDVNPVTDQEVPT